jgi:hypothetical protein
MTVNVIGTEAAAPVSVTVPDDGLLVYPLTDPTVYR